MPIFNFSVSQKKVKQKKETKSNNSIKVELKNIKGVVFINDNAEYYINADNGIDYKINDKSYSCKNKSIVYRVGEYDTKRVKRIRPLNNLLECNPNYWLPFGIGCVVVGNIINEGDDVTFVIHDCYTDLYNEKCKKAFNYYLDNIDKINTIIKNKRLNGV